jgi:protein CrcB
MLTYLYIALGGAIGSVARAWTTNVMVRAVGADFPWGTILINVVGSFIIGFYGAVTASDGRFTAHPDARAFVMVGICGGYTTFSSFSLQTLDLARDGKLGAAFANIALSVILCLLSVTAGYASATAINRGAIAERPPLKSAAAGGTVLAVLESPASASGILSSAARLLEFAGGGRLTALNIRTPPISELMIAEQAMTPGEEARLRAIELQRTEQVRAEGARWEAGKPPSVTTSWVETEGDIAHVVADYGRRSDSLVVAALSGVRSPTRPSLHAALFDTSRPVLVTPAASVSFGRTVAVAWKDDLRAPKAVLSAIPILAKAEAVHVLRARVLDASVPAILREHGIPAQVHIVPGGEGPVGEQLLKLAHSLGADLIVMGAYTHGEWREALLGGVTRYMLDNADLPLFMQY